MQEIIYSIKIWKELKKIKMYEVLYNLVKSNGLTTVATKQHNICDISFKVKKLIEKKMFDPLYCY